MHDTPAGTRVGPVQAPGRVVAAEPPQARAVLELEDGTTFEGRSFGAPKPAAGEVVFNTSMVGYPEALTDASYCGQILALTYPLVGNYGIAADAADEGAHGQDGHGLRSEGCARERTHLARQDAERGDETISRFESDRIHVEGLIVADYCASYSHWSARRSLAQWLIEHEVPAITGIDTRALTQRLREKGTMLGVIRVGDRAVAFRDPNTENLVARVSIAQPRLYAARGAAKRVALIDVGVKHNIIRSLLARGLEVLRVPWDHDLSGERYDAIVISNGPGDPKMADKTVATIRNVLEAGTPTFGICLGHQLLALAIGADTYKLKYGHRSQNQPVREAGTDRCFVTSQNHGYAVDGRTLPEGWRPWFVNLNDDTNEGLRHEHGPFASVQFHPEAAPGPVDTAFLFDQFAGMLR